MTVERPWLKQYRPGVPHELGELPYESVADMLVESCEKFKSSEAYVNFGKSITYSELDNYSKQLAAYLQAHFKTGDSIAIMMPNVLQYPIAVQAILRAGMVVSNVNPLYTPRELKHQLNDANAKAIIVIENTACTLAEVINETGVEKVITTTIGEMVGGLKGKIMDFLIKRVKKMVPPFDLPGSISFKAALNAGQSLPFTAVKRTLDDIAFLQYTGGTTGVSKGAMLTNRNMISNVTQTKLWISSEIEEGKEIIITALPLYHIFALTANCLTFCLYGAKNVLITNPRDMPGFVKELSQHKFTVLTGVNTLFNGLLITPGFSDLDFSAFKFSLGGGMAVQKNTATEWKKVTGVTLAEAYGLTETSPAACINQVPMEEYTGNIGLPLPGTDCQIQDDDGNPMPVGERGELCIRGPQVMLGYLNRPEETAKTIVDGWLKTGDVAIMDEQGYFKIVDRKKNMILVSGFNVFPNEIEDAACLHSDIIECAAIGIEDERSGEIVKLFVVRKNDSLTEKDVIAHCRAHLTGYKVPKLVEFRDELPKSNVGKILHKDLRE
ncbi:AMP-binding protein [Marinicella litoralis]|uniref:Long-chain-fatty-acid--CoA ligase n=1 Tax=Marinicella litoralis TaxID=644220 RepID=A0A4V3DHI8_9GAMM|nr:AMP-binding protein [Marinicella litoralis]TDR18391.1 long-chain acyl-CoA synthetase [Marinicella litoralis]